MKLAAEWNSDDIRPLAVQEFDDIRRLAHRAFGLDLKTGKEELVSSRLRHLLRDGNFPSFREYLRHVLDDRTGQSLASMIDALATNHTAFLREPDHFDFLRDRVFPEYSRRPEIEIWSAACSTGEEVWTLACLANETLTGSRIRIQATDISGKALRAASRATYSAERCKDLPARWLSRYFVVDGKPPQSYRAHPDVRSQAVFSRINLIEPFSWARQFPVIFCRNVMIYFDQRTQEQVVQKLYDCLEPGGYLFVGHAESLSRIAHKLEYVRPAVYRKPAVRGKTWAKSS